MDCHVYIAQYKATSFLDDIRHKWEHWAYLFASYLFLRSSCVPNSPFSCNVHI